MKKEFSFFILSLLLMGSSCRSFRHEVILPAYRPDVLALELKENEVNKLTQRIYVAEKDPDSGKIIATKVKTGHRNYRYHFDSQGNILEVYELDNEAKFRLSKSHVYTYTEAGEILKKAHHDEHGRLYDLWSFEYDEKGNKRQWTRTAQDGSLAVFWEFTYNEAGDLIREKKIGPDSLCINSTRYSYNYKDREVEEVYFSGEKDFQERRSYAYGRYKDSEQVRYVDQEGKVRMGWDKVCKKNGSECRLKSYGKEEKFEGTWINKKDKYGNLLEESRYDANHKLDLTRSYQYTYDSRGNWVEKIYFFNGEAFEITIRQIQYLDS